MPCKAITHTLMTSGCSSFPEVVSSFVPDCRCWGSVWICSPTSLFGFFHFPWQQFRYHSFDVCWGPGHHIAATEIWTLNVSSTRQNTSMAQRETTDKDNLSTILFVSVHSSTAAEPWFQRKHCLLLKAWSCIHSHQPDLTRCRMTNWDKICYTLPESALFLYW